MTTHQERDGDPGDTANPSNPLFALGLQQFLEADPKPTCVLNRRTFGEPELRPIYINKAFRCSEDLASNCFESTTGSKSIYQPLNQSFHNWIINAKPGDTYDFAQHRWHLFDFQPQWRVLQSNGPLSSLTVSAPQTPPAPLATRVRKSSSTDSVSPLARSLDWTDFMPPVMLSDHVKLFREHNWDQTSVGPMYQWSHQLRNMANLIMASPNNCALWWGQDPILFYNEGYARILANKHPWAVGRKTSEVWAEVWQQLQIFLRPALTIAKPHRDEDTLFLLDRGDFIEETYFTFTFVPIIGNDGKVCGMYNEAGDVTRKVMYQRRMDMLLDMSRLTTASKTLDDYWQQLLMAMEPAKIDVPFAILYSLETDADDDDESTQRSSTSHNTNDTRLCRLEGAVGIPTLKLEVSFDSKDETQILAKLFRKAATSEVPLVLDASDPCWPQALVAEQDPSRGFGDKCRKATVYTLRPSVGAGIRGFMIVGLCARQPYDDDLALYRQMLGRHITSSLASTLLFQVELRRYRRRVEQAATDRAALTRELMQRVRDTEIVENRFYRVAQQASVGIFILDTDGSLIYCNDKWYELSGVSRGVEGPTPWIDNIWHEDLEMVMGEWRKTAEDGIPIHFEMRFKSSPDVVTKGQKIERPDQLPYYWVLASAYPDTAEDGTLLGSITGVLTDISHQKWAEDASQRRALEALEAKRQQENFVDMVSHEIRNPLNAILQCADTIITSSRDILPTSGPSNTLAATNLEAAETIVYCADHQRRIVDDILTLSKLDSDLLTVTPIPVQPLQLLRHAIKIFHTQSQNARVDLSLDLDESLTAQRIDWVLLDPSRVLQVIINLLTNAIKFTASDDGARGKVTIGLSASSVKPVVSNQQIHYFPSRRPQATTTSNGPNGMDDQIFLSFYIRDTGQGLTEDQQLRLFNRFSQASPRTHIQYGGSGLGLYISRQLAELQGGQIGMASEAGRGSVFAFYVESKQCLPPERSEELVAPSTDASSDRLFQDWLTSSSILIVEDNIINQKILRKQLTPLVKTTHVANNGVEALEVVRSSKSWTGNSEGVPLTVILMDIEMPIMGGLACIKEIRRLEEEGLINEHLKVIAITANARSEQINTAKEAGMDEVLPKPFVIKDLKEVLKKIYRSSSHQQ